MKTQYKLSAVSGGYRKRIGIYETIEEAKEMAEKIRKKYPYAKPKIVSVTVQE